MKQKFLLFIDALKINHAKFYNFVLFKKELEKLGNSLDIMIPPVKDPSSKDPLKSPYIFDLKEIKTYYQIDIIPCDIQKINTKNYNGLFITEFTLLEKNNKFDLYRQNVVDVFTGPIICLKCDTIFEYYRVKNGDKKKLKYGMLSSQPIVFNKEYPGFKNVQEKKQWFLMSLLCNPAHPKIGALSREEFCSQHGLDPQKKIVAYLPGFFNKMNNKHLSMEELEKIKNPFVRETFINYRLLNTNFDNLVTALHERGYQLVGKLHVRNAKKFFTLDKNDKYVHHKKITYVDQFYYYELLKHADFCISIGTTMVYYLYLCNLPVMDFGSGNYFPSWSSDKIKNLSSGDKIDPFKKYNSGKDLFLGKTYSLRKYHKHTPKVWNKIIKDFENTDHAKNFKYFKNHPIYGKSYQTSMSKIVKLILERI